MKKLISSFVTLAMIMTLLQTSAFAIANSGDRLNYQVSDIDVVFLQISSNKLIYKYEENGNTYKIVDDISSPNIVKSEVYLLADDSYILFDTIEYIVNDQKIEVVSNINGTSTYEFPHAFSTFSLTASEEPDWEYQRTFEGDTFLRNLTIGAIATALGSIIGGYAGAFISVATLIFEECIDTVYYTTDVYKDMNSPKLRPVYKHVTYFYKDEARTIELDGNPVVTIIDGT